MTDKQSEAEATRKQRLYLLLEGGARTSRGVRIMDGFLTVLIVANVAAVAAETMPWLYERYGDAFIVFETVSVLIFAIEYLLRLWVCTEHLPLRHMSSWRARLNFARTPYMVIDLLAILPTVLLVLFGFDFRAIRIFRLLRLLKLARYSPAIVTLAHVLYAERRALGASMVIMFGLLMLSSSMIYYLERVEQPDNFGSIPASMWWAMATLTTVGYGDVVPHTALGKIFGGLVTILGIAMYGLPIAIIASGFTNEFYRRDFIITWGMIANVPLFSRLPPHTIEHVTKAVRAREVPAGYEIMRRGDEADAMYIIITGQVRVELPDTQYLLGEGDYFGILSLMYNIDRPATVDARSECQLMMLMKNGFDHLIETQPELMAEMKAIADQRMEEGGVQLT